MEALQKFLDFFSSPAFYALIGAILFLLILIWLSFVYWVYRDAAKRGAVAPFWAFFVFLFNFLGLILYLILRPPEYKEDVVERELEIEAKKRSLDNAEDMTCPACGKPVEQDFLICPNCKKKLRVPCGTCGRALKLNWTVCPYCGSEVWDGAGA